MNNSSEKVEGHYAASKHKDKDAERTGKDKSEAQIQCYIVFKVPKATTAPMQQDIRALLFRNLQWTRRVELHTAIKEEKEGKLHPPGTPLAVKQACCQSDPLLRSTHKALGLLNPPHTHT